MEAVFVADYGHIPRQKVNGDTLHSVLDFSDKKRTIKNYIYYYHIKY